MLGSARSPRTLVLLVLLAFAALAVALGGCGHKTALAPIAPDESASGVSGLKALALEAPALQRAIQAQNDYTLALMVDREVVGTATGLSADGRPAVLVLTAREGVRGIPATLDGVPVETRVVGIVTPYAPPPGGGTLQMGTSTGNDKECASGTLGCVVLKGGTRYFLSNNHVFARQNAASNGERIDAPGRYDAHPKCAQTPICGTLAGFKAISFSSNNTIDAAIALPDPGRAFTCAEACGYTPSATAVAAFVGQAVKKCGRTSGLTHGSVTGINVTIQVQYSSGVATFVSQVMMGGSFIRSGDSGSLMVEESSNNPVGLCFAGGSGASFANPIGAVLQNFGATVCNQ